MNRSKTRLRRTQCDCFWHKFLRLEQQIGTREAAAEIAAALHIEPKDVLRLLGERQHAED